MPRPYFEYKYFAENDNKLHKNSYAGHYVHVIKHIRNGINIYKRTLHMLETPLFLAISNKQMKVASYLLDLYQCDLKFVEEQFINGRVKDNGAFFKVEKFWLKRPILIAFGEEQCRAVDLLYRQYEKFEDARTMFDIKKCVVVLLKSDNFVQQKVLFLTPETKFGKIVTLKIIKTIIGNGFLDLNGCIRRSDSYIKVASLTGLYDVLVRLIAMGVDYNIMDIAYTTMKAGQVECLEKLHKQFRFDIGILVHDEVELFNLIGNNECAMYIYMVEKLIEKYKLESDLFAVWKEMIDTRADCKISIFHYVVYCNRLQLAEKLLCFKPDLVTPEDSGDCPIHDAFHNDNYKCLVKQMIQLDRRVLSLENAQGKSAIHLMAEKNWLGEFIEYYQGFPERPNFFAHLVLGEKILYDIVCNGYFDMAEYIIENEKQLISYDVFYNLLNAAAGGDSTKFIKYLLSLKFYNFLQPTSRGENPLITALIKRKPDNFILLRRYVEGDFNKIRDKYNNNLLKFAIWGRLVKEPCHTTKKEIGVDDLPNDILAKMEVREQKLSESEITERSKFNKIFEDLVSSVDYHVIEKHTGMNLLHHCALQSNDTVCNRLLDLGVDPAAADLTGNLPLHYATSLKIFQQLNSRTDAKFINHKNELTGDTLLHNLMRNMDINHPQTDLLEEILKNSGDVTASNQKLQTPLHLVRNEDWCRILLKYNPDVNARDIDGCTPIHSAFNTLRYRVANVLLESESCDYLAVDNKGVTYLSGFMNDFNLHQKNCQLFPKIFNIDYPKFKELLHVHCNSRNEFGTPVLIEAIYKNETMCEWLLEQSNIDLNIRETETGITPLHATGKYGKNQIATELLKRGCDVDVSDADGNTPLHQACLYWYETGLIFIRNGANVIAKNNQGATPISLAAQIDLRGTTICELLLQGADITNKSTAGRRPYDALNNDFKKIFKFIM